MLETHATSMVEPVAPGIQHRQEAACPIAQIEVEDVGELTKPKRKRAPKKEREGANKGMQITLRPNKIQAEILRRWAGTSRWVWNWALALQNEDYRQTGKMLSTEVLSTQLTPLMKTEELAWLGQVPRTCITQTLNHLNAAWQNFFKSKKGERAGKAMGKPDFWAHGETRDKATFQIDPRHNQAFNLSTGTLRLPGLGLIQAEFAENIPGLVSKITIFERANTWTASLALVDVPESALIRKPEKTKVFADPLDSSGLVALDASVVSGAVGSADGKTSFLMAEKQIRQKADQLIEKKKRAQRFAARKQRHRIKEANLDPKKPLKRGVRLPKSNRQIKLQKKIANFDLKALFSRRDLIHKFTTDLVRNHHTIVVETLALAGMAQILSRGFRRRFHQACMGEIIRQLEYKCEWFGRTLIKVDRWFPSSKRCSNPACHIKNTQLQLKDRAWTCPHCLTEHDRDQNAAFNLWQEGWRLLLEQSSTSYSPVGSTGSQARRVRSSSKANIPGQGQKERAMKRETNSCLPTATVGMEPMVVVVG